jgi:ABC-type antimicrobial peptide transport system permease subunit
VIGVVANIDWNLFDQQRPAEFYEPTAGLFAGSVWNLHVRVGHGVSADRLMASCHEVLRRFDERIPVPQIRTLTAMQRTNPQVLLMEIGGLLFGIFGTVAVGLSFLGVYGLKAYEVTRRTREIGIRIALGATAGNVLNMILVGSARLALWGMGFGFLLSLAVGRLTSRFLYRVLPFDPLTFAVIPLLLLGVVLFACLLPARRAAKTDPMEALRYE